MGCESYTVNGVTVSITYDSDEWPCLCTLAESEPLSARDIRSMAALGAAVALTRPSTLPFPDGRYSVTPRDLPDRVKAAIEYFIPVREGAADGK